MAAFFMASSLRVGLMSHLPQFRFQKTHQVTSSFINYQIIITIIPFFILFVLKNIQLIIIKRYFYFLKK